MINNGLVDAISHLNPTLQKDKTYLDDSKRIDHIFLSSDLADLALKAGYLQFHQHFVTDHKGEYIHFKVKDLFDEAKIDTTPFAFRELQLENRDKVADYIEYLEQMYEDNKFVERLNNISTELHQAPNEETRRMA